MERNHKRRVAHIGQDVLKKKSKVMNDVVTDIMKSMDADLTDEILKNATRAKGSDQSKSSMASGISKQPNIMSLPKKFQNSKRHLLMEKVQKNIKYMNHNRRMPKPRAHLGELRDSVKGKKDEIHSARSSSTSCAKNKKSCGAYSKSKSGESSKSKPSKYNIAEKTSSDNNVSDASPKRCKLSDLSSDSESESFESFLQEHKQNTDGNKQETSKRKKRGRPKKDALNERKTSDTKRKKHAKSEKLKSLELESSDDQSLRKTSRKHKSDKICSKLTKTNRLLLPMTDDSLSSTDDNELGSIFFETEEASVLNRRCPSVEKDWSIEKSIPCVEKENDDQIKVSEQINTNALQCTVRIERNQLLEETVLCSQYTLSISQGNNNELNDSDDDCMIVCEVPQSDDRANDFSVAERSDTESDIQICNVVSLCSAKKCQENTDDVAHVADSPGDANALKIDYQKLKEAIEIAGVLESHSDVSSFKEETLTSEENIESLSLEANIMADSLQAVTDYDLKKASLSLPTEVIETVKKMDKIELQQILSLTNNIHCCPSSSNVEVCDPIPCSSSSTDELPSFNKLSSNNTDVIAENHWQNFKKAVSINHAQKDLHTPSAGNLSLIKPEKNIKCMDDVKESSREPSTTDSGINSSTLKNILSNAERLKRSNDRITFQDEDANIFQFENNLYEDSCYALDTLTSASILDLCRNQNSENLLALLCQFAQTYQDYIGISRTEKCAATGLKVIQDIKAERKKHVETVLEHILKRDPCLYSTAIKHVDSIIKDSSKTSVIQSPNRENASSDKIIIKKCVNCGLKATIECGRCRKVYFCGKECGQDYYWEKGHYKECEGSAQ